jgi:hypothetical protein
MSFLDDIMDIGSSVWSWATGGSTSAALARAAALGLLLNEVTKSINKPNNTPPRPVSTGGGGTVSTGGGLPPVSLDQGVRLQLTPDTQHSIPVVYGSAYLGGIVTDARMTNNNKTMWYCITICERTGKLIDGTGSQQWISNIFWGDSELKLQANGIHAEKLIDANGNQSSDINGLVSFYPFYGGSRYPGYIGGYTAGNVQVANNLFPEWTSSHTMDELIFVLVKVDYNKDKNITGIPEIKFKVNNTMKQPGDVLFDYMTNTRYGAGIPKREIKYI